MTLVWLRTTSAANVRNDIDQLVFAQAGLNREIDHAVTREFIDAALGNMIGNEDLRARHDGFKLSGIDDMNKARTHD